MTSCLSELKVTAGFCFAYKIPDDVTATNMYTLTLISCMVSFNYTIGILTSILNFNIGHQILVLKQFGMYLLHVAKID